MLLTRKELYTQGFSSTIEKDSTLIVSRLIFLTFYSFVYFISLLFFYFPVKYGDWQLRIKKQSISLQ